MYYEYQPEASVSIKGLSHEMELAFDDICG